MTTVFHASFLRYYIRHLPYRKWQSFWAEVPALSGWDITAAWKFDYPKSYGYALGTNIHEVSYVKRKCDAVIEHHQPSQVSGSSYLWTGEARLPTTTLDDILVLLSVATSRYVHAVLREYFHGSGRTLRSYATGPEPNTMCVVQDSQLGQFLVEALKKLHAPKPTNSSAIALSLHWYYQGHIMRGSAPSIVQMAMFWVTLEILAKAMGFKGKKKAMVSQLLDNQGFTGTNWAFLDGALSDWYKARNAAFHEGQQPSWNAARLTGRLRQITEFSSFLLADLLVPQQAAWKSKMSSRIQDYVA